MQGNPEFFCMWNLESWNFDGGIQDPGLWNPKSRTTLYSLTWGRQGDALTPEATEMEFIDDFISLGSVIGNEDGVRLVYHSTANRLKSSCVTAA